MPPCHYYNVVQPPETGKQAFRNHANGAAFSGSIAVHRQKKSTQASIPLYGGHGQRPPS